MRYLFCLLLVFSSVIAQPIEGPYQIETGDFGMIYKSAAVNARGDYLDIFYIGPWDRNLYAAEFSIESRSFTRTPYQLLELPNVTRLEIHDPIALDDDRWAFLLYEGRETGSHYTKFIFGDHDSFSETLLDSGYVDFFSPSTGDNWIESFSLTPREGGGAIAGWFKGFFWNIEQPSFRPAYCLVSDAGEKEVAFQLDYATLWTPEWNRAVFRSLTHDIFYGAWGASDHSNAILWGNNPDGYDGFYQTLFNSFESCMNLGRTHNGRLPAVFRSLTSPPGLTAGFFETDDFGLFNCNVQYETQMPGDPVDSYWHPDFGFAVLSQYSNTGLGLARIDTSLNEVQPAGVFWQTPAPAIENWDLTISDDGHVFVLWSFVNGFNSSLELAAVEWDTFLNNDPSGYIPEPSSLSLSAYPNPFNSTVKLSYELPVSTEIALTIYNTAGQEVATIIKEFAPAGSYEVAWTPEISSGMYFAHLWTPTSVKSTKLLYLR